MPIEDGRFLSKEQLNDIHRDAVDEEDVEERVADILARANELRKSGRAHIHEHSPANSSEVYGFLRGMVE